MSDSDRAKRFEDWLAPSVAINICAMFFLGAWYLDGTSQNPSREIQRYETQCSKADSRYRAFLSEFPEAISADDDSPQGKREKRYREQEAHWCDLLAQQTSAEATRLASKHSRWITWLTIAGVLMLGWTLRLTRKAVTEAEKTTDAVIGEQRPWIKIEEFGIDRDVYSPFIKLKNVGKSPAVNIDVQALIVVRPIFDLDFAERMKQTETVGTQEADLAVLPGDFGKFVLPYDVHRDYEQEDGGGEHIYCILISYTGSGCKNGRSFSIWNAVNVSTGEPDNYEEDERARQYT